MAFSVGDPETSIPFPSYKEGKLSQKQNETRVVRHACQSKQEIISADQITN